MLRSIGKQPGESVESVLEKERKAMVGRIKATVGSSSRSKRPPLRSTLIFGDTRISF